MKTYGSVKLCGRFWVVSCEPHVRTRLKRTFPRAPQEAADEIRISNNPENARDLEWFLQRFPMEISWLDGDQLRACANAHRDTEKRVAELLEMRSPPPDTPLAVPAREYQRLVPLVLHAVRGLLLADDVGLGKTVSAICSMVSAENLPALVVCPAHIPRQWEDMVRYFAPHLTVHRIRGGKPYPLIRGRAERIGLRADKLPDVLIVSYHSLRGWAETLAPLVRYVVFDEAQQLRNPNSLIYEAAKHVARSSPLKLGLSATPIYNYGSEFFWVLDVLRPGALGERNEFVREWCSSGQAAKERISKTEEFGAYLRREGLMLRRTRREVGRELPGLTKTVHAIDADTDALSKLEGNAVGLARIVLAHNERFRGQRMQAAGEFDAMMRQATGVAKAPYVAAFVRLLCDSGEKVLLFGWHRDVYAIWLEHLKDLNPVMYTGSESPAAKDAAVKRFAEGDSEVMIMSLRSGAGVDGIQDVCRTAVIGEFDWSPGVHEQCIGRLYRDGQDEPVLAYFMASEHGSDPVMVEVLGIKREQIEGVRNPGGPLAERIETNEHHIRRLAREFLERRGEIIPEQPNQVLELRPSPSQTEARA